MDDARPEVMDWPFLERQCFGDFELEAEVLALFSASAAALVAALPAMSRREQDETAHRLRGSCLGIGAWAMAGAARDLEVAPPRERGPAVLALGTAFADVDCAIRARFAARH